MSDEKIKRNKEDDYEVDITRHRESPKGIAEILFTIGSFANTILKNTLIGITIVMTLLATLLFANTYNYNAVTQVFTWASPVIGALTIVWINYLFRNKSQKITATELKILKKELFKLNTNLEKLQAQNTELEQRLSNVELLESFEDKLAKHTLEKQALIKNPIPKSPTPPPISANTPFITDDSSQEYSTPQGEME